VRAVPRGKRWRRRAVVGTCMQGRSSVAISARAYLVGIGGDGGRRGGHLHVAGRYPAGERAHFTGNRMQSEAIRDHQGTE
jgi:hypothetical protein